MLGVERCFSAPGQQGDVQLGLHDARLYRLFCMRIGQRFPCS